MMCVECELEGNYQTRYYLEKTNTDFCPRHGFKQRTVEQTP